MNESHGDITFDPDDVLKKAKQSVPLLILKLILSLGIYLPFWYKSKTGLLYQFSNFKKRSFKIPYVIIALFFGIFLILFIFSIVVILLGGIRIGNPGFLRFSEDYSIFGGGYISGPPEGHVFWAWVQLLLIIFFFLSMAWYFFLLWRSSKFLDDINLYFWTIKRSIRYSAVPLIALNILYLQQIFNRLTVDDFIESDESNA